MQSIPTTLTHTPSVLFCGFRSLSCLLLYSTLHSTLSPVIHFYHSPTDLSLHTSNMGRWTQVSFFSRLCRNRANYMFCDFQDSYSLPDGMQRIGYDSDTHRYTFRDRQGAIWQGGEYGGELRQVSGPPGSSKNGTSKFCSIQPHVFIQTHLQMTSPYESGLTRLYPHQV